MRDRRFKRRSEKKRFEVTRVWEVHREIVRRILVGQKNREIAKSLGVSDVMVSYTRNSPIVQTQLAMLGERRDQVAVDLAAEIKEKAPKALKLLEEIIDGIGENSGEHASINLRAGTAEKWLDRAGYVAPKNDPSLHLHAHRWLGADDIEKIKQRARDAGMIDVTPQES